MTREMCNVWKSDRLVASIILQESLGKLVCEIMGWPSVRIAQDDVIWKPPYGVEDGALLDDNRSVVGFHQDSFYISSQFEPQDNNSVTVWMALDDADDETGCIQYVPGSHLWVREFDRGFCWGGEKKTALTPKQKLSLRFAPRTMASLISKNTCRLHLSTAATRKTIEGRYQYHKPRWFQCLFRRDMPFFTTKTSGMGLVPIDPRVDIDALLSGTICVVMYNSNKTLLLVSV